MAASPKPSTPLTATANDRAGKPSATYSGDNLCISHSILWTCATMGGVARRRDILTGRPKSTMSSNTTSATVDPVSWLLDNLEGDDYTLFSHELSDAVTAVCANISKPDLLGPAAVKLADTIRSWHITLTLQHSPQWVASVAESESRPVRSDDTFGTIDELRELLSL